MLHQGSRQNQSDVFKVSAQLNEVATKKSLNSAAVPEAKSEESAKESPAQNSVPDVSSISAFMTQVAHVVKLVDSRDIMELQLKQLDCELVIRKKEALQVAAPAVMMQPHSAQAMVPYQFPQVQVSAPDPSPPASAPVSPSPAKPKSSCSPLKCPMAGTFYRCPAPGAPPFVKVGDKVQKGIILDCSNTAAMMRYVNSKDNLRILMNLLRIYGHRMALWASIFASNALVKFFKDFHPFSMTIDGVEQI